MKGIVVAFLLALAVAFCGGLAMGRYSLDHPAKPAAGVAGSNDSLGESFSPDDSRPRDSGSNRAGKPDPSAPLSPAAIVARLKEAMAHPSDRHGYLEASKLIDAIDPKNIRVVIEQFQKLPAQREKSIYLALLISRWAEGDPQAALTYAQTSGSLSERRLAVTSAVRSWAEKDANAARSWAMQLPPGQERDRALQAVVSSLAESDPAAALAMLDTLPNTTGNRQPFYWPIFSRWATADPVTAAARAVGLPPGSGHDNAIQIVASTWGGQDPEAAFAWAGALPPGQAHDNAVQTILANWAGKDPQHAATIASSLPPGPMRDRATANIARQWAQNDPHAAL
ncbi:MAG TPA: hypothetical protein VGF73_03435, partial [Chthoniobacterales bacterium]